MLRLFLKTKKNKKGFTLTELIVVVAILGVLAAVGTPLVMGQIDNARVKADNSNAKAIENVIKIALANEELKSTDMSNVNTIISKVHKYLNPIPKVQKAAGFYLTYTDSTGELKVEALGSAPTGAIEIKESSTPTPTPTSGS